MKLYGWYIKQEGATKTIIIAHGRKNNRTFCLKFLQLFKDMQLNEKYNIFLPDLRNSGKSDESITAFGYYFARDIKNAILMLNERYMSKEFILYGFSQGAMAASFATKFYEKEFEEKNIKIEKLILDSPVSNVTKIILHHSKIFKFKIPYSLMEYVLSIFNLKIDNNLDNLRLSKLLGIRPTLILQSEKDDVTPYEILKKEFEILKKINDDNPRFIKPEFKAFRKGQHVRMYMLYKNEYTNYMQNFLNE